MQLNKKEKKRKELLRLYSEIQGLSDLKYQIEPIKLEKPISHGYIRFLRIRAEYNLRGDLEQIKKAFALVGQKKAYSKNKDFLVKNKYLTSEKHAYLGRVPDPRFKFFHSETQREKFVEKIKECENHLKSVNQMIQCCCGASNCKPQDFLPHFEFKKPWMLEEKTEVNWLTHYTPVDCEIESKLSELEKKMYAQNGWELLFGRRFELGWDDTYGPLKSAAHAYLHGYPRPRIDEIFSQDLI